MKRVIEKLVEHVDERNLLQGDTAPQWVLCPPVFGGWFQQLFFQVDVLQLKCLQLGVLSLQEYALVVF